MTTLWNEKVAQIVRLGHRRGQSDAGEIGSEHEQSRQSEESRSPRFDVTSACNSSSTIRLSDPKR